MKFRKILLVCVSLVLVPVYAAGFDVDNLIIDTGVKPIRLGLAPEPGMKLATQMKPNAVLTPFSFGNEVWPGYYVKFRYVKYVVAVSCGTDPKLPCSLDFVPEFSDANLMVQYVQTSDANFVTPEGLRVGSLFEETTGGAAEASVVFTGDGECVRLKSGWNACFQGDDLAKDSVSGQYRPRPNTRVYRFIK